ncbi:MAG: hypothetical protein MUE97_07795, partial [Phycisphaerales bacterium]|nr:hypothetical protein [Phycisphaerales bacterium]
MEHAIELKGQLSGPRTVHDRTRLLQRERRPLDRYRFRIRINPLPTTTRLAKEEQDIARKFERMNVPRVNEAHLAKERERNATLVGRPGLVCLAPRFSAQPCQPWHGPTTFSIARAIVRPYESITLRLWAKCPDRLDTLSPEFDVGKAAGTVSSVSIERLSVKRTELLPMLNVQHH